ncbi:MAG: UDP-glucose 4-epimerase GalE, partial [Pirellulales bacterium]|nr:UDP-glucose 4-epimerase GalE [Pirellulales bacterium]
MNILVIGGAGYIGSCAARLLDREGHDVWIYDDLSTGHAAAALDGRLIEGSLHDRAKLVEVLKHKQIEAVMHFAAFALVGESVANPGKYYQNNVVGTIDLLEAMREADVRKIVFSSTTATYGTPEVVPITESETQKPINPYGFTKLVIEQALADYVAAYDFAYAALRYFNAAGAAADGKTGEDHDPESHLIPIVLQVALGQREHITIFGDGGQTRDFVYVSDVVAALQAAMGKAAATAPVLNVCRGEERTIAELAQTVLTLAKRSDTPVFEPARPGDIRHSKGCPDRITAELDWHADT